MVVAVVVVLTVVVVVLVVRTLSEVVATTRDYHCIAFAVKDEARNARNQFRDARVCFSCASVVGLLAYNI